jgi:antirestriction protein
MTNVRIYVGTYHKYNCGSLEGKWVDLDQFSNLSEFYCFIRNLHSDEEDPEFMFQDYECPDLIESMGTY